VIVYHNRFGTAAGWIRDAVAFAEKGPDGTKTQRRDTLASALGLAGPDDGWLRLRDRRAGTEALRSLGELRSRGLFVQLDAYGCLVIDELREVASTADEPWAALAAELGGGWVPSLDDALADLRLRPVHDRVASVVVAADPALTGRRLAETLDGLDRRMFDELRLATALRGAGMDDEAIRRVRLAIGLPHPRLVRDPAVLVDRWLEDPEVRSFLEVHEWTGRTYLSGERWLELVALAGALDRAAGARRASPALARLRTAAETAGHDVERLPEAVALPAASRRATPKTAKRTRRRRV
jgi:hypothetical protein